MLQDLVTCKNDGDQTIITCEAKITRLDCGSSVIVLRDISDRVQLFEAEKRLVKETAIRKKDAEANRFTRHEVKNGILAAIGLLEHLRETMQDELRLTSKSCENAENSTDALPTASPASIGSPSGPSEKASIVLLESRLAKDIEGTFSELDSTLRDVLDTILDEAMAREIIYGEYEPRKELMQVSEVLASLRREALIDSLLWPSPVLYLCSRLTDSF